MAPSLRTIVDVVRAEGIRAAADRWADRWHEARLSGRLSLQPWPRAAVLNVLGVPLSARGGGVPQQCAARLRHESRLRPVALLSRSASGADLVCWSQGRVWARTLPGRWSAGTTLTDDPAWTAAVDEALRIVGARAVHVENAYGVPLAALARLGESTRLIVSAHDFALAGPRPHLLLEPEAFGGRAAATAVESNGIRRHGRAVVGLAEAVVCPSVFVREQLTRLLGWNGDRAEVIAPGLDSGREAQSARVPREVAFVGGGADHKGGTRWLALARLLTARGVGVTVYGGDGHENLLALRAVPGVRVRGYYRAGTLPRLLVSQGASVVVLMPCVAESFSLTLSEAWAAGVPVVAPSSGALVERMARGGGRLTPACPTDDEVVEAVDVLRRTPTMPVPVPPTAEAAAAAHLALYQRLALRTSA